MKTRANACNGRGVTVLAMLVVAVVFLGGCCHVPKSCCKDADFTVAIATEQGKCVIYPDDALVWNLHTGMTIKFVNATDDEVTVKPSFGAYRESNVFSIEACSAAIRTVADLPENSDEGTILHEIECGGDDHGGPKVVVTEPPGGSGGT